MSGRRESRASRCREPGGVGEGARVYGRSADGSSSAPSRCRQRVVSSSSSLRDIICARCHITAQYSTVQYSTFIAQYIQYTYITVTLHVCCIYVTVAFHYTLRVKCGGGVRPQPVWCRRHGGAGGLLSKYKSTYRVI